MTMPKSDQETIDLYASIMEEIKIRIDAINKIILMNDISIPPVRREWAYLQLRMICELIALGCLIAHGDIKATSSSDMRKAYAADYIMKKLGTLHSDYFPYAHTRNSIAQGQYNLSEKTVSFMTKDEFISLVRKCGEILHRGSLKNVLGENVQIDPHLPDVQEHLTKIIRLLETHHIHKDDGRVMLCMLKCAEDESVSVAMARQG